MSNVTSMYIMSMSQALMRFDGVPLVMAHDERFVAYYKILRHSNFDPVVRAITQIILQIPEIQNSY